MQAPELTYATALLRWSRSITEHGLDWTSWQQREFGSIIWD